MRISFLAVFAVVIASGVFERAEAVWFDETAHYIKQGYRQNEVWPWPYICPDRMAVREPFCIMINNGWRRQNLLGSHHFNQNSTELTRAGELRVHWIMTQAPADRRQIFVERDIDTSITEQRLATARSYATQVAYGGATAQVSDTHLVSEGRPASVVDTVNMRFHESMPAPVLPEPTVGIGGVQ